ncbi:hypothetical protein OAY83_00980, partial [Candidatus Marinimicrobia bacterium]|nr:hypothetical protein [Candidatus Neomarinimicrobiota bacterium]
AEFCDCFGNSEEDCNGVCGGSAVEDIFSVCGGDNTIQNAIDNAQENDVIIVPSGTYFESLNVFNSVSIVCEDPSQEDSCILDARGLSGSAVTFSTSQARLEGFTIPGDNTMFAGVTITPSSRNIEVINNRIYGMTLSNPGNDSPLSYGVLAYGNSEEDRPQDIMIIDNDISMIGGSGISLGDFTGPVMIAENNIHDIIPVEVLGQPFSAAVQGRYAQLNFENNTVSNVIIGLSIPSSSGSSNNNSYSNVSTYLSTTIGTDNEFAFNQSNDLNYWISESTLEGLGLAFVSYVSSLELATMIADSGSSVVSSDGVVISQDCNGDWGGTATTDNCGTCDSDSTNDCPADCNGVYGGSAVVDDCGVCGGDNSSCSGCDGVPNSGTDYDGCGICGGNNLFNQDGLIIFNGACGCPDENGAYPYLDCNGTCDFDTSNDLVFDDCGVCGGDNSSCTDCNGVLNGLAVIDDCGVCGGDNYVVDSSNCTSYNALTPNVYIFSIFDLPGDYSLHFINENNFYMNFSTSNPYLVDNDQSFPERIDFSDVSYDSNSRVFLGTIDFTPFEITVNGASKWEYEIIFSDNFDSIVGGTISDLDAEGNVTLTTSILEYQDYVKYCGADYFEGTDLDCSGVCNGDSVLDDCGICNGDNTIKIDFPGWSNSVGDCDYWAAMNYCGNQGYGSSWQESWGVFEDYLDADGVGPGQACVECGGGLQACDCDGNVEDCEGVCGGDAVIDDCGVCDGPGEVYECGCSNIAEGFCDCDGNVEDCEGVCGGDTQVDCTGVCGGNVEEDCNGECGGNAEEDCAGVCNGDSVLDECGVCNGSGISDGACDCQGNTLDDCGVCGGFGINANGWQVSISENGTPHGCDINFYSTPSDYVLVESESFENCAYQCENYSESCTSFDFKRESSYSSNCLLWLNGACDLNGEELPLGYASDQLTEFGEDWMSYTFTGQCDCSGATIDCAGTCGLAEVDACGNCLGDCAEDENGFVTCSDNDYNVILPDCAGVCAGSSDLDGENCLIYGCTDSNACNYSSTANTDDGSCLLPPENYDCLGECIAEVNCLGGCGGVEISDDICLAQSQKNLITSGAYHILTLQSDSTVVGWGNSSNGRLDIPDDLTGVVEVAGGRSHTIILKDDGTVQAWGYNNNGQTNVPEDLTDVISISAGYHHSLALKSDGTVVGWGRSNEGQTDIPENLTDVVAIDAGNHMFSLALKSDGTVVGWGSNNYGQATPPTDLADVVSISGGYYFGSALKSDGTVVGWGRNNYGQTDIPTDLTDVVAIDAGYDHIVALKSDGTVVGWGRNNNGQLNIPADLTNVIAISASGDGHTLALKSDGTVVGWGRNNDGETDIPSYLQFSIPCTVAGDLYDCTGECGGLILTDGCGYCGGAGDDYVCSCDEDLNCSLECSGETNCFGLCGEVSDELCVAHENKNLIASGGFHSAAIQFDDTVIGWGRNNDGESTPPEDLSDVVQLALSGNDHYSLALKSDGTVVGWGRNNYGQATPPADLTDVISISAGYYHSLALKSDGTVVGWGRNNNAQLDIPLNLTDVVAIDAGQYYHNIALTKNGTVVGWGRNNEGQLDIPEDLTDVIAIASARYSGFGLKSDGTVVGWGRNDNNVLNIPEDLTDVVAIDAGAYHVLALKSDGTVVTWGSNGNNLQTIPEGLDNVVAISASGDGHSLALKSDGTVVGWGRSGEG